MKKSGRQVFKTAEEIKAFKRWSKNKSPEQVDKSIKLLEAAKKDLQRIIRDMGINPADVVGKKVL